MHTKHGWVVSTLKKQVLIFCLSMPLSYGQTAASQALQVRLNSIKTLKASFHQSVSMRHHRPMNSSGTMALAKPRHFRWETTAPTRQLLVADGRRIWNYDPGLEQVSVKSQAHGMGGAVGLFLSDVPRNLDHDFAITSQKQGSRVSFALRALSRQAGFKHLTLHFEGQTLVGLTFIDALGQHTSVQLSNVRINQPLSLGLFQFKRPHGVDLVDQ